MATYHTEHTFAGGQPMAAWNPVTRKGKRETETMRYDYHKARSLETKAENLVRFHRIHVFDETGDKHTRAVLRINRLLEPMRRERHSALVGERLTRMGY